MAHAPIGGVWIEGNVPNLQPIVSPGLGWTPWLRRIAGCDWHPRGVFYWPVLRGRGASFWRDVGRW